MGLMDFQIGFANESTYGTGVTVTRFFEYESESISDDPRRTEGDPLRVGSGFVRNDRFTPYYGGASGTVQLAVMDKGFGFFNKHLMGTNTTTGASAPYTHTATEGTLYGNFFTCQINKPFNPAGTNQAITYSGGKVTEWTLSNSVEGNLLLDLNLDFAAQTTATALATASYPTSMNNLTWAGGVVSIGGSAYDVTEFSLTVNNGLNVDRRQIRGNTDKKEPTSTRREGSFSITADFDSLTQRNRALATTRAGALASLSGTWTFGTASLTVTVPQVRFDAWEGSTSNSDAIMQNLSGVVRYDGSASPVTIAYVNSESTA